MKKINEKLEKIRLDKFLNSISKLSRSEISKIISNGMVSVNCVQVSDTEGFAFSSWNTMEEAENAADLQSELMGGMKEWLAGPPERMVGKLVWSWSPEK